MKQSTPSSSSFSSRLPSLLEKCSHWDKDERYMATNDLRLELLKGAAATPLDEVAEGKVCACVLKQLDDASNDVQSVAVQTLGVLFKRVRVGQIERFADKLCDLIVQGKTSLRDIYAICLRNLLSDVPDDVGAAVAERIALRLLGGIVVAPKAQSAANDTELKRECIDTLSELLLRFGASVNEQHSRLVDALVANLDEEAHALRKRAAVSIGSLAASLSDDLLAKLVQAIVARADRPGDISRTSTSVHALGMVTRSVGRRLRTVMRDVMGVFLRCSDGPEALAQELQEGGGSSRCEMVEFCLGGLEAAVRQCPREARPYLAEVVDRGCAYLAFDPNYNYADEEADDGGQQIDQDEYGGYEDEGYGYDEGGDQDFYNPTEDDDASWKLRRAAARVLSAVALRGLPVLGGSDPSASSSFSSRAGMVGRIGDALTGRIAERVEAVKMDVLETLEALMLATLPEAIGAAGNRMHTATHFFDF
jgi:cullin-associated NEDD8-dissociated protein 1